MKNYKIIKNSGISIIGVCIHNNVDTYKTKVKNQRNS